MTLAVIAEFEEVEADTPVRRGGAWQAQGKAEASANTRHHYATKITLVAVVFKLLDNNSNNRSRSIISDINEQQQT